MNPIYLRRRRKLYLKDEAAAAAPLPLDFIATVQKNLESLGFLLALDLLARLQTFSPERAKTFYRTLVSELQEMVGAHRQFKPMYPLFPLEVMQMSEAELYYNAVVHYATNRLQSREPVTRSPLIQAESPRVIELGSKEDFERIFTQLAAARTSLSPQDKLDAAWFVSQYRDDIARLMPPAMPFKENLAFVAAQLLRKTSVATELLKGQIKTATDVLRIAVALSDGDVSLAEPTKFKNFRRSERRQLLAWLESTGEPTEDMLRWAEPWKRLGERLHPGDYRAEYPLTFRAFCVLRSDEPFSTFNGQIERTLKDRDTTRTLELLEQRPGDLARRLDHLLRISQQPGNVLSAFSSAANRAATPLLLQVMTHFRHRADSRPLRAFFPKGEVAKVFATANKLSQLPTGAAESIVATCEQTLHGRFQKLPALGQVFIDPRLKNYLVPFSQRSASKSLRTLVRGSRIPLPAGEVLRFFLWWKNGKGRTDIDLSAVAYDGDFKYVDLIAYYNLKNFGGCHSGDIVDAPQGAAEFIDLNIELTRAGRVRYVVMCINSFTAQPYCDLPECFAGWMSRQEAGSGEVFEPRTVQDKVDVASNTRLCIPAIFDLQAREVIWADIALRNGPSWNNVQNNLTGVSLMLRALTGLVKTDLHTLFSLHATARGEIVADPAVADTVFGVESGITPFDSTRIAAEFL